MQALIELVTQHGLAVVFVNVLLAQLGAPVPAVPMLLVAGALAAGGSVSLPALLCASVAASLLADTVWFCAGRRYGARVLRLVCSISISPDSCVRQTESIFERWGLASLTVAKFVPGFALVAPPLVGALRLALTPFLLFSAIGAALWAGLALACGWLFHAEIGRLLNAMRGMGSGALALIGLALAAFIAYKWGERRVFFRALRAARISVQELRELIDGGSEPVILDARSELARSIERRIIPGARPIDTDAPDGGLEGVPTERDIIVYCT